MKYNLSMSSNTALCNVYIITVVALSVSLKGSSDVRDVSPLATPAISNGYRG